MLVFLEHADWYATFSFLAQQAHGDAARVYYGRGRSRPVPEEVEALRVHREILLLGGANQLCADVCCARVVEAFCSHFVK